jgi:nucleotide-binding universal stress UspA family protein
MQIQNLLIPTDFSASAEEAVQQALTLAAQQQAHVLFLYVLESLALTGVDVQTMQALEQTMQADTERRLQATASQALIPVQMLFVWGTSAAEVCCVPTEHHLDLIVMSTYGSTGFAHFLIGSVAERVVRHASCAVLILRAAL